MKNLSFYFTLVLFAIISFFLVLTRCKNENDKTAPVIPPESTFIMDFSDYQDADTASARENTSYLNWWWAASNVVTWNIFITVGMVVPVASFKEAFQHEGIYDPDGDNWIWSYNFTAGGTVHLASLQADLVGDSVQWKMYITRQDVFTDVLWYYGTSSLSVTGGYWIINKDPQSPVPMVKIIWHRNPALGTGDIQYVNVIPEGAENGGYIYSGITGDPLYDAFYNIYNKGADNLINVNWNRTSKAGQVKDPAHFEDADWHCWNEQLQDISCR